MNRKPIITSPCSEDWNQMHPTQKGRFCDKCELEVVDFTGQNSDEIVSYIDNANGRVCGRMSFKPNNYMAYAGALSSLILLSGLGNQVVAQGNLEYKGEIITQGDTVVEQVNENGDHIAINHIKKHLGIVVDMHDKPVPFAKIWVNGIPTALTDVEGRFLLELTPEEYDQQLNIKISNSIEYNDTINVSYYNGQIPIKSTYVFREKQEIQMMLGIVVAEPRRNSSFGEFGNENTFDMDEERPVGRSRKRR